MPWKIKTPSLFQHVFTIICIALVAVPMYFVVGWIRSLGDIAVNIVFALFIASICIQIEWTKK